MANYLPAVMPALKMQNLTCNMPGMLTLVLCTWFRHTRGKGINRMILDVLMQWAKTKNISELKLDVYNENASAIKAYEKAGFTKYMVNMRMGLK